MVVVVAAVDVAAVVAVVAVAVVADVVVAVVAVGNQSRTKSMTAIGLGYRPELALYIERREDLGFVEILAEDYPS